MPCRAIRRLDRSPRLGLLVVPDGTCRAIAGQEAGGPDRGIGLARHVGAVRQRAGTVLSFAKAKGWRTTEGPGKAVTLGLARHGRGGNFAAMAYNEVPAFVASQSVKADTMGRLGLLFTIYTAARSGEVRSALWAHIDLDAKLWHRPASLMKSGTAHSVTLSDQAVAVLERANALRENAKPGALVFPGTGDRPLSDMTLSKVLRDAKQACTVHGFRSSFRDWAAEQCPSIPDPVAEAALAHSVSDKVVAAYKRTDFLAMRRKLLDLWGEYVEGGAGKIVQLGLAV
jgi:integrase